MKGTGDPNKAEASQKLVMSHKRERGKPAEEKLKPARRNPETKHEGEERQRERP